MPTENVILAFALTLFAGLSTGIGSALAYFARRTNTKFLCVSLGFSAGVMIYVSFVEILAHGRGLLAEALGGGGGNWAAVASFFGGIAVVGLIDRFIPEIGNPHEVRGIEEGAPGKEVTGDPGLYRMGLLAALALAIHNFPEGMATFSSALAEPNLGIPIAVAIAIHNIPEGIAVSVPIFYATGSRRKAFFWSFASGLAEPLGALAGFLVLSAFLTPVTQGVVLAAVAGIMVFISLDELLPAAEKYGEHHVAVYGLVAGMAVMALSLQFLCVH